jgi:hypothetical protein
MYLSITIANEHWRNTNQYSVFVTDDTGHGKTIMAIYNNNDGRPTPQNGAKATLVVTPPKYQLNGCLRLLSTSKLVR